MSEHKTTRCPECGMPNGWHKAPCATGELSLPKRTLRRVAILEGGGSRVATMAAAARVLADVQQHAKAGTLSESPPDV